MSRRAGLFPGRCVGSRRGDQDHRHRDEKREAIHAWQLWSATGNPLFPMYNHIFKSPEWLPTWISGGRNLPRSALEFVFYPFIWAVDQAHVTEITMRDLRLPVLYCAFAISSVVALARLGSRKPEAPGLSRAGNARVVMALVGFIVISYVIWMSTFGIYRYAIVLESLTGAGLIAAAAVIFGRSEARVLTLLLAVFAVANVWITRPDWGHVDHTYRVIDVEPLLIPAGALVVIVDRMPHGYLVPFLPADVRVVSIDNNFVHPGQAYGLNRRISEIVSSHSGAIAVISSALTDDATMQAALAHYRLRAEACLPGDAIAANELPIGVQQVKQGVTRGTAHETLPLAVDESVRNQALQAGVPEWVLGNESIEQLVRDPLRPVSVEKQDQRLGRAVRLDGRVCHQESDAERPPEGQRQQSVGARSPQSSEDAQGYDEQ